MFDINKPHQRRDGGEFEIVTVKDGHAFGFYIVNDRKLPNWWFINGDKLSHDKNGDHGYDIIQLPEEKVMVKFINVYFNCFGAGRSALNDCKRVAGNTGGMVGIIKTTAKIIDGKLVSVKSEIVE